MSRDKPESHEREPVAAADGSGTSQPSLSTGEIFDACLEVVATLDARTGHTLSVNPAFGRLTGLEAERWIGRDHTAIVHPEDQSIARQAFERAVAGESVSSLDLRTAAADGRTLVLEWSFVLLPHIRFVLAVARDVTERRRVEGELSERERRYRELFESAFDMLYTHDLKGRFLSLSPSGERLLGIVEADVVGTPVWSVIAPEFRDYGHEVLATMSDTGRTAHYAAELVHSSGKRIPVEGTTRPIARGGKIVAFQGAVRDLSRRIALEAQLSQAGKMEAVGTLAGGVAHDFNNMLTVIIGYARLGLSVISEESEVRPYFDGIHKTGERAAMLTRQLLAFARKQVLRRQALDLNRLIRDFAPLVRRLLPAEVELRLELTEGIAGVSGDPGQLEQVILSLALNARDAMPGGGVLAITTVKVRLEERLGNGTETISPGDYVLLTVRDDGCGIPREIQSRIFEPFFTTKKVGQGPGLGLALVYGIVRQHEGQIEVDSEPGRGTALRIHLPAALTVAPVVEIAEPAPGRRGHETILIVEDEAVVRDLVTAVLSREGYRLLTAADGEEGLRTFDREQGRIDLIVADLVMPRMGGRELCDRLAERGMHPPFLFMSGYASAAVKESELVDRGHDFLQKPFEVFLFARRVHEILDRKGKAARA